MNLATAFSDSVKKRPDKIALYWGESEYSYAELWDQTLFVANHLGLLGVKAGDRVGVWLKNCPEFVPALFGILEAGAAAVPINNFLKPDEVNYILADAGIDVLITDAELGSHSRALTAARPHLKLFKVEADVSANPGSPVGRHLSPASRQGNDLAVLIYTSGTTGRPKGEIGRASCRERVCAYV